MWVWPTAIHQGVPENRRWALPSKITHGVVCIGTVPPVQWLKSTKPKFVRMYTNPEDYKQSYAYLEKSGWADKVEWIFDPYVQDVPAYNKDVSIFFVRNFMDTPFLAQGEPVHSGAGVVENVDSRRADLAVFLDKAGAQSYQVVYCGSIKDSLLLSRVHKDPEATVMQHLMYFADGPEYEEFRQGRVDIGQIFSREAAPTFERAFFVQLSVGLLSLLAQMGKDPVGDAKTLKHSDFFRDYSSAIEKANRRMLCLAADSLVNVALFRVLVKHRITQGILTPYLSSALNLVYVGAVDVETHFMVVHTINRLVKQKFTLLNLCRSALYYTLAEDSK